MLFFWQHSFVINPTALVDSALSLPPAMATMYFGSIPVSAVKFRISIGYSLLYFILVHCNVCDSSLCSNFNSNILKAADVSSNGSRDSMVSAFTIGNYSCPGDSNPKHHSECCNEPEMKGCCPKQRYFYEIEQSLAQRIVIGVVSSCVLLTLVMTICCFWSKCPLYTSCRTEFSAEIPSYDSKAEVIDMDTMPKELSRKGKNAFSPIVVSNGNLSTDAENNAV